MGHGTLVQGLGALSVDGMTFHSGCLVLCSVRVTVEAGELRGPGLVYCIDHCWCCTVFTSSTTWVVQYCGRQLYHLRHVNRAGDESWGYTVHKGWRGRTVQYDENRRESWSLDFTWMLGR